MNVSVLFVQTLIESERGWGQRPDGYIIANSRELCEEKVKDICSRGNSECYNRPGGECFPVEATEKLLSELENYGFIPSDGWAWVISNNTPPRL